MNIYWTIFLLFVGCTVLVLSKKRPETHWLKILISVIVALALSLLAASGMVFVIGIGLCVTLAGSGSGGWDVFILGILFTLAVMICVFVGTLKSLLNKPHSSERGRRVIRRKPERDGQDDGESEQ